MLRFFCLGLFEHPEDLESALRLVEESWLDPVVDLQDFMEFNLNGKKLILRLCAAKPPEIVG